MLAGLTLGGRYEVIELIASGGMGEVYRARDRELDELVALKVIRSDRADAAMVERFRSEVKLARRVTHANVARTFELGHADDVIFCTMELVEGETLEQRLARQHRLDVGEAVGIACAVCDALIAAHAAQVIHRDIKPANILIAHEGRVVLADFGIAAAHVDAADHAGTPAYMAPEQARGEPATPATDVYAVGVVLYEMLSGQRAFSGTLAQITELKHQARHLVLAGGNIAPELADVVARTTAMLPADRLGSATALRHALAPWATADLRAVHVPRRTTSAVLADRTLVVIAPSPADDTHAHIAYELHERLLATLAHSTLRVLPRTESSVADARYVIRYDVGEELVMRLGAGATTLFTVSLPLAIEQLDQGVAIASAAIHAALKSQGTVTDEAEILLSQARQLARQGLPLTRQALALLDQALALRPGDPRIEATRAIMLSRLAFVANERDSLRQAGELVRGALAHAPDLADAHLAAGHHELHVGDPVIAAGHYRVAIACAPLLAEAHEHLGRVLVEAGYLDAAFARFAEATAIAPQYSAGHFEVARALALEGRWDDYDRLMLDIDTRRRPLTSARTAWWRGDKAAIRVARGEETGSGPEAELMRALLDTFLEDNWGAVRDVLVERALDTSAPSRRRAVFIAQVIAEGAAHARDDETCLHLLEHAATNGLFDLHWLDRVPLLAGVRGSPRFASLRTVVEARARGIYDALYGDHAVGLTVLATD